MGFAIASSPRVLNKLALQTWHKAASGCKGLFRLVANRVGRAGAWWHIPKMHPQRPPEVSRPNADAIDTRHMRSASYVGAGIWKRCQMFTANCGEWRRSDLVAAPGRALYTTVFLLCGSELPARCRFLESHVKAARVVAQAWDHVDAISLMLLCSVIWRLFRCHILHIQCHALFTQAPRVFLFVVVEPSRRLA
jgi:hypothetical protein